MRLLDDFKTLARVRIGGHKSEIKIHRLYVEDENK